MPYMIEQAEKERNNLRYKYILIGALVLLGLIIFRFTRPYMSGFLGAATIPDTQTATPQIPQRTADCAGGVGLHPDSSYRAYLPGDRHFFRNQY